MRKYSSANSSDFAHH